MRESTLANVPEFAETAVASGPAQTAGVCSVGAGGASGDLPEFHNGQAAGVVESVDEEFHVCAWSSRDTILIS
jgi:alkyl hydroperoxide reductase subunit AhpC